MSVINIHDLKDGLEDILRDHEDHLTEAQGFGLKIAVALMPYAEARRIVDSFEKDTAKLQEFLRALPFTAPTEYQAELDKIRGKAQKAFKKFEEDREKAEKALEKHEDLLVGEYFQAAFERVRLDIIKFDPAEDIDLDFKTELHMEATPSYAAGVIYIKRGTNDLYRVTVGYQAEKDFYYGNIYSEKTYKTYKNVVQKNGHVNLPRFSKDLTEQLKALTDIEDTHVFGSRKQFEFKIPIPANIVKAVNPKLIAHYMEIRTEKEAPKINTTIADDGLSGTSSMQWNYWWPDPDSLEESKKRLWNVWKKANFLKKPFEIEDKDGHIWTVTTLVTYTLWITWKGWPKLPQPLTSKNGVKDFDKNVWADAEVLSQTANGRTLKSHEDRIIELAKIHLGMPNPTLEQAKRAIKKIGFKSNAHTTGKVEFFLKRKSDASVSAQKVARRWLNAGASDFGVSIDIPDVRRAYEVAVKEALREHGERSYNGTISTTSGYRIRRNEPFTNKQDLNDFVNQDIDNAEKWGPAFAVPYTNTKKLKSEEVTVEVKARNDAEAIRKATMLIKAKGRVPPKASIVVTVKPGDLKKNPDGTYIVKGTRDQSIIGQISGWHFYGWAAT